MGTITLRVVEHGETTITVDQAAYEQAKTRGNVAELLDALISDVPTDTVLYEPDGTRIDLHY